MKHNCGESLKAYTLCVHLSMHACVGVGVWVGVHVWVCVCGWVCGSVSVKHASIVLVSLP